MYNVLIVDDEMFVRIGITNCVDWEANGMNIPRQASNGKEAWELIQSFPIDIILTDIRMPEMDGILLIKEIRKANMSVEVIILSCVNEFEYVQEAFRLGACDYLFKPTLLPKEIIDATLKVIGKIEDAKKTFQAIKKLKDRVENHLPKLKQQFLLELIYGRQQEAFGWEEKKNEFDIKLSSQNMILLLMKADIIEDVLFNDFGGDEFLLQNTIMNILDEVFRSLIHYEMICKQTDEYIILISHEPGVDMEGIKQECDSTIHKALTALKNVLRLFFSVGISRYHHTIETLKMAYGEANYAIEKRFFLSRNSVIYYDSSFHCKDVESIEIGQLINSCIDMDESGYLKKVSDIFFEIKRHQGTALRDIMEISANMIFAMLKNISRFDGTIEQIYQCEGTLYTKIYQSGSIDELENFMIKIAQKLDAMTELKYRSEVYKGIKFMEKNLGNAEMGLETVADHVNMSKNYFSKLFKETTGTNFIEYLTRLRVEKAKELYTFTNLKVYQIAEKVGYSDWRYFCKVFKKQMGEPLSRLK